MKKASVVLVLATVATAGSISYGVAQDGEASKAYMAAMHKSMNMDMAMTGDADVDFVQMMIPHHQGAVDMAKVELKYGKDPEIRKLAEDVIAAQEKEISWMQDWLKKHGH